MSKKWRVLLVALVVALTAQLGTPSTVGASDVEDPLSTVVDQPSPWDLADIAATTATGQTYRCPEGMYVTLGACKYAQADFVSTCTLSTSSGNCYARTINKLRVRGGTADSRSPNRTGACPYGSESSFGKWQTTDIRVVENQGGNAVLRYQHTGVVRDNCDVQAGPFWVSPNITVHNDTYIIFTFKHYCRADATSCGDSTGYTDFWLNIPS